MDVEVETELPPDAIRRRLLDGLARVVARAGFERLVSAPLLLPDPRFFPDPWEPNLRGARRLLARLMLYAGLDHLELDVTGYTEHSFREFDATGFGHAGPGAAAWFGGIEDGVCRFGVSTAELRKQDELVGVLCHEVAHAFRHEHGLSVVDRDVEERLTDLTAVYLGFGVLLLESSLVFETGGYSPQGERLAWERRSRGYLSPAELAVLVGAQLVARGLTRRECNAIAAMLSANHEKLLGDACELFGSDPESLRDSLGVPPADEHPDATPLEELTRPLPEPQTGDEPGDPPVLPGETARRLVSDRGSLLALSGAALPLLAASVSPLEGWILLGAIAGGATLGLVAGKRLRTERCSACRARLDAPGPRCPGCARVLAEPGTDEDEGEPEYDYYSDPLVSDGEKAESKLLTSLFVAWAIRRGLVEDDGSGALDDLAHDAPAEALFAAWPWIRASLLAEAASFADAYFDPQQGAWPEDYALLTTLVEVRETPATFERFASRFDARFEEWKARR
jgi:hypothetical protein